MNYVQVRSSTGRSTGRSHAINLDRIAFIEFLNGGRSNDYFDENFSSCRSTPNKRPSITQALNISTQ